MRSLLVYTLFLFLSAPAFAQQIDPIFSLQQDESLLHVSATEQRDVDQDLLIASLRIEIESADSATVQDKINTAMRSALDIAKRYKDVKAVTRAYNVQQYDQNRNRKNLPANMIWKGQQSLQLKSKNAEQLLELAGKIQDAGFLMGELSYSLSPDVAAQIQDEMLESALQKLQNRAERAAKALGKKQAVLKEINTQNNYMPRPQANYARMDSVMVSSSKVAPPVASPGETTITMTVSAKALLK